MELVLTNGRMEGNSVGIGVLIKCMGKVYSNGEMGGYIGDNILMIGKKE